MVTNYWGAKPKAENTNPESVLIHRVFERDARNPYVLFNIVLEHDAQDGYEFIPCFRLQINGPQ